MVIKNYNTSNEVLNNSELIIQITHATIILFPIVGLSKSSVYSMLHNSDNRFIVSFGYEVKIL